MMMYIEIAIRYFKKINLKGKFGKVEYDWMQSYFKYLYLSYLGHIQKYNGYQELSLVNISLMNNINVLLMFNK
jgi:hypothetical protein